MQSLISLALAVAAATSAPIQVQSTPARESANKAEGFGKHLDQSVLKTRVVSVSTASIRADGRVQLNCETHRAENHASELNEQKK